MNPHAVSGSSLSSQSSVNSLGSSVNVLKGVQRDELGSALVSSLLTLTLSKLFRNFEPPFLPVPPNLVLSF